MTVVLVDVYLPPAPIEAALRKRALRIRTHRPAGPEDNCVRCGWHWPCPAFFDARYALISAAVPPSEWAH